MLEEGEGRGGGRESGREGEGESCSVTMQYMEEQQ